jgi:hypothetical protein
MHKVMTVTGITRSGYRERARRLSGISRFLPHDIL